MLKLEKAVKSKDVSLSIRASEPFLNRSLSIALAIACGLHLAAFLLFKIGPIKLQYSNYVIPTVIVNADLGGIEADALVRAHLDEEEIPTKYIFEPPLLMPQLIQHVSFVPTYEKPLHPFLSKEKELTFHEIDLGFEQPEKILQINAFGNLNQPHSVQAIFNQSTEPFRALYEVRVDNTGHIFWFHLLKFDGKPIKEQILTSILQELQFPTNEMVGEIEIAFKSG